MPLNNNVLQGRPVRFTVLSGAPGHPGPVQAVNDGNLNTYDAITPSGSVEWVVELPSPVYVTQARWRVRLAATTYDESFAVNAEAKAFKVVGYTVAGVYNHVQGWFYYKTPADQWVQLRYINAPQGTADCWVYEMQALAQVPQALVFANSDDVLLVSPHDFGNVIAGNLLGPLSLHLYNMIGSAVALPQVTLRDVPTGEVIELSKTQDPFIPEDPLIFSDTFAPDALIGTIYVRIQPPITSGGTKTFKLRATARPV